MTGFEPQTSGIGIDRSTNWATTTAHEIAKCLFWCLNRHKSDKNNLCFFKQKYTLKLFIALGKMVNSCCFSLRGNQDFKFSSKKFYNINTRE